MSVRENLRVLREQWLVVLLCLLVSTATGACVWQLRPAQYTANLTLYVSAQTGDNAQTAYQGGLLSQERVKSYVELLEGTRVSAAVATQLNLPRTPAQVARQITAAGEIDSVIIRVAVTDRSASTAARMADTVGTVFVALVDELERPSASGDNPPVQVRIVERAATPTAPSTPGLPLMLLLGAVLGLVVGVAAAAVRNLVDASIGSPEELREVAGTPTLAVVAHDSAARKHPLTTQESSQSPRAEAFRQLRTNLQFLDVDRRHQVLIVTSPLASEGKTSTVLNLGIALVAGGQRVLVIDADLRRPTVARVLGLEATVGLTSVLAGRVDVATVIQQWAGGLDVITSGPVPPNPSEMMGSRHMRAVIDEVRQQYDVVLLDSPPLLPVTDAAAVAPATDGVLLVARSKRTTAEQVRRAMEALTGVSANVLGTVLTMVPTRGPGAYARYNAEYQRLDTAPEEVEEDSPPEVPTVAFPATDGRHHASSSPLADPRDHPAPDRPAAGRPTAENPAAARSAAAGSSAPRSAPVHPAPARRAAARSVPTHPAAGRSAAARPAAVHRAPAHNGAYSAAVHNGAHSPAVHNGAPSPAERNGVHREARAPWNWSPPHA